MVALDKRLAMGVALSAIANGVKGDILGDIVNTTNQVLDTPTFEWTALGDSYSSGVGAGDYVSNSYRCLRYSQAYPSLMDGDNRFPAGQHEFHNAVCSGSTSRDVEDFQFYDEDKFAKPNRQFGARPRFGNPQIATLSVGGNDIDFPGIIFNCMLETHLPFGAGPPVRSCDEQKKVSWDLLNSEDLPNKIDKVIKKTVEKARKGPIGDKFRLYVTGFPQFFSDKTDECDKVTFARAANPNDDGKEHTRMTQELRREFNQMSIKLNEAIETAVTRNTEQGVTWIPIDGLMKGHRYCEPGIKEPDQHNPNLWLYHYPYNEPQDNDVDGPLLNAYKNVTANVNINEVYPTYNKLQNALLDAVELPGVSPQDPGATQPDGPSQPGGPSPQGGQDWLWKIVGARVKVFHPQVPLHEHIRDLILQTYVKDAKADAQVNLPLPPDKNMCHGINGDYWVMSRDVAIANVAEFCSQQSKEATYNKDSVNELSLSVKNLKDDTKGPSDAPDCVQRFQNVVIDGCDGNDKLNNPHNYKFGSTFTAGDGWEYKMTPLSKQVNEVSCDLSYKFFWDGFEIRGKNLPDAKLGANGEGLHHELSGCGAVTRWNFEVTPDDVKFQWYASGRLPIGTKGCVGRALVSAGGANNGNCHGPGKRYSPRRPSGDESTQVLSYRGLQKRASIDEWPGYGDESKHVFKHPTTD